ncbi:MAG: AAA family ATPase [Armatimonadota bacterium]
MSVGCRIGAITVDGKRFITKLRLRNLLSFGPEAEEFELEPLNVLIGPNASGKSNVIEAISLLQAAPDDIQEPIRRGGGVGEWLWKGGEEEPAASVDCAIGAQDIGQLRYSLAFACHGQQFDLVGELIDDQLHLKESGKDPVYHHADGHELVTRREFTTGWVSDPVVGAREVNESISRSRSVLAQLRDPQRHPEITYIGAHFAGIRIYGEWHLGRATEPRKPQMTDLESDFLSEDAKNLALVINDLQNRPGLEERLNEELARFYPRAKKITVRILGGTVQLQLHEEGLRDPIPATRMSDGTLRYLCLLSILLHPDPPPLVCIEEPEIGLHPDIVVRLAHLMQEASERMQLIVTTHSDALVAALSGVPEAVAICERDENGSTTLRRLSRDDLGDWLERYTLGDLWMKGELGGVL